MPPLPESIHFTRPLRQVHLVTNASAPALTEELEQEIYERGRRVGEQALEEQLARQRLECTALQTGVLASLQAVLPMVVRDCETSLAHLAFDVAQKLVSGLTISPEMVEAAMKEALAQAEDQAELNVLVHPEDLELLRQTNSPLLVEDGAMQRLTLQASSEVSRGGCIVKTRFGIVDARRETKLRMMEELLQAA